MALVKFKFNKEKGVFIPSKNSVDKSLIEKTLDDKGMAIIQSMISKGICRHSETGMISFKTKNGMIRSAPDSDCVVAFVSTDIIGSTDNKLAMPVFVGKSNPN